MPEATTNPETGARFMTGGQCLAWAVPAMDVGGQIRGTLIDLQAQVRARQGEEKDER